MPALANLIQSEASARGWSLPDLAAESGVPTSTLYKIINNPDQVPALRTLALLSAALKVPFRRLIEACGYPIEEPVSADDWRVQASAMVSAIPELRDLINPIAELPPEDRGAVLSIVRAYVAQAEARKTQDE